MNQTCPGGKVIELRYMTRVILRGGGIMVRQSSSSVTSILASIFWNKIFIGKILRLRVGN
jgi:hypothetical protein